MSRKRKPLPLLEKIEITDIAAEGKAIAKVDGYVIFVPFVVPGDIVDLQLTRKKHSYAEAEVVKFHTFAEARTTPFCPHFGVCGGCKWQMLPYQEQLRFKHKWVADSMQRIAKIEISEILPTLGSVKTQAYRNKLEFAFSNKKWLTKAQIASGEVFDQMNGLGFHITGAFDNVLDISACHLMDDINNRIRNGIRAYALENGLTFFDLRQQVGLLRNLMLRQSSTGEIMLLIQFCMKEEGDTEKAQTLMQRVKEEFPEITSLLYVDNQKANDTFGDLEVHTFSGSDYIMEEMENLKFKVGPKSFYQTNSLQAYELYKATREFAGLTGDEVVYDLYTGTGTIANFVAAKAKKVVGIEYVPEAIEDAKVNAALNALDKKTMFYAGDMKDVLNEAFIDAHGQPDVIITVPPRAGMHPDVVETILKAAPKRIVYVSCNPATQARDLALLDKDYKVVKMQPVDMFPHTYHVENVALLEKR